MLFLWRENEKKSYRPTRITTNLADTYIQTHAQKPKYKQEREFETKKKNEWMRTEWNAEWEKTLKANTSCFPIFHMPSFGTMASNNNNNKNEKSIPFKNLDMVDAKDYHLLCTSFRCTQVRSIYSSWSRPTPAATAVATVLCAGNKNVTFAHVHPLSLNPCVSPDILYLGESIMHFLYPYTPLLLLLLHFLRAFMQLLNNEWQYNAATGGIISSRFCVDAEFRCCFAFVFAFPCPHRFWE